MSLVIGIAAGWIAEQVMKRDHGLLTNLIVGAIGGLIGGALIGLAGLGEPETFFARLISATFGAILLLWLVSRGKKRAR